MIFYALLCTLKAMNYLHTHIHVFVTVFVVVCGYVALQIHFHPLFSLSELSLAYEGQ